MPDEHAPIAVIDRDLAAIAGTLPPMTPDQETFRRCRALGRRNRRRRLLTATAAPVLLIGGVFGWATVHTPDSGPIVGPVASASPAPTTSPGQALTKIHKLDVSGLPAGATLVRTGNLIGLTFRVYTLPSAPGDRLIMTALVGDSRPNWPTWLGTSQTHVKVNGDPALLSQMSPGTRVDWVNVRQHVSYTVMDESGTLTQDALLKIAGSLKAQ